MFIATSENLDNLLQLHLLRWSKPLGYEACAVFFLCLISAFKSRKKICIPTFEERSANRVTKDTVYMNVNLYAIPKALIYRFLFRDSS